jgi:hypothetical protein
VDAREGRRWADLEAIRSGKQVDRACGIDQREISPLRRPTIRQEDEWEEKVGLLRSK